MVKLMKLKGQVRLNMDRSYTFIGKLYDQTQFDVENVTIHDFETIDEFEPNKYTVDGWLYVVQEAKQDTRVYLTLPKPSITHGKQILVNELQLMPRSASINDFKPQKMGGKVKIAKIKNGQVVESTEEVIKETIDEALAGNSEQI